MIKDKPSLLTRGTILLIALVQVMVGLMFIVSPHSFSTMFRLAPAPAWTDWIFSLLGARALGFAYGMWIALKDTRRHKQWLAAMIGVQLVDWVGVLLALSVGKVALWQVTTAPFLPVLFVIVLAVELNRQRKTA